MMFTQTILREQETIRERERERSSKFIKNKNKLIRKKKIKNANYY